MISALKIAALAGGVGGAKLVDGLAQVLAPGIDGACQYRR